MPRKKITPEEAIDILKTFCSSGHKNGKHCPLICKLCPIKDSCTTYNPRLDQKKSFCPGIIEQGTTPPLFWAPNSEDKNLENAAKIIKNLCYNTFCSGVEKPFYVYKRCILGRECFVNGGRPTCYGHLASYMFLPCDWGEAHAEEMALLEELDLALFGTSSSRALKPCFAKAKILKKGELYGQNL